MVAIDRFRAIVNVNGEQCNEFSDDELDTAASESDVPSVARYIEASPGQNFALRLSILSDFEFIPASNSVLWCVYLDGVEIGRRKILRQKEYLAGRSELVIDGSSIHHHGRWNRYPFVFPELDITQESIKGDPKKLNAKYKSLGTIEVRVFKNYTSDVEKESSVHAKFIKPTTVSEKALKGRAVTLGAGYGTASPCLRPPRSVQGYIIDKTPLAIITFHYRTKKSLQDLMILPKDDTKEATAKSDLKDDIESMTAEELRLMLREQMAKNSTQVKFESKMAIKREISIHDLDGDDEGAVEVVRETKRRRVATEVIEID